MNDERFDSWSRWLARRESRRQTLRLIASSALGLAGGDRVFPAEADGLPPILHPILGSTPYTLQAAGDIASCDVNDDELTARLLDERPLGIVATLGDNVYDSGTSTEFNDCYRSTWGRHKDRTRPAPGNHDYATSGAAGYFAYFGTAAGPPGRGYYSYNLGNWHIVSLNSNVEMSEGSPQGTWLQEDLAENKKNKQTNCLLAYWHHARFSTGRHGSNLGTQALWQALYDARTDVVLVAHDHHYERFAPMDAAGQADPLAGIREFVVGTGGGGLYYLCEDPRANTCDPIAVANSEFRTNATHGVLQLMLYADHYEWRFVSVNGQSLDAGSGTCHCAGLPPHSSTEIVKEDHHEP